MAQRGRVPQFGKWEDGNAAYTMIFETARKDKNGELTIVNPNDPEAMAAAAKADRPAAPRVIVNPNDPEENPQAFRAAAAAFAQQEHRQAKQGYQDRTPPANQHQPPNINHNASQARQRQGAAGRRPPEPAANYGLAPASPLGPNAPPGRKVAVPKFGGWNDNGHAPTEGYTVVFDKVKEEKQQIAHGVPSAAPPPRNQPDTYHQRARPRPSEPESSFWTKLLSCFNPSAN